MTKSAATVAVEKKLAKAREVVRDLEFGTDAWESAMEVVRDLVDQHLSLNPVVWTDKEWNEMMSR
jgi:hypothetical protein